MPFFQKGDVRIRYEEVGSGFPLLVTPGGGLNSRVSNWPSAAINAMEEFKNDFRCITMDQRNANGGESTGPVPVDNAWDAFADDQLGLMDHLGIREFFYMGYCIGGCFAGKLLQRAPARVVTAVFHQTVGDRPEDPGVMYRHSTPGLCCGAPSDRTTPSRSSPRACRKSPMSRNPHRPQKGRHPRRPRRSQKRNPSEGRRPIAPGLMPRRRCSASWTIGASRKRRIYAVSRRNSTRSGRPRSKAMKKRARRPRRPWSRRGTPTAKPAGPTDLSPPCAPEALPVSWRRISVCGPASYPPCPWPPSSRARPPSGRRR